MITFIILWAVVTAIFYFVGRSDGISIVGSLFIGALVGIFIGGLITLLISMGCANCIGNEHYEETIETEYLAVFKDGKSVSGTFFLGCGSLNGRMSYTYYAKYDDGGFELKSVSPRYYRVYETDSTQNPRIERSIWKYKEGSWKWEKWVWFAHKSKPSDELRYKKDKIFVPTGTIKEEFKLDAE